MFSRRRLENPSRSCKKKAAQRHARYMSMGIKGGREVARVECRVYPDHVSYYDQHQIIPRALRNPFCLAQT